MQHVKVIFERLTSNHRPILAYYLRKQRSVSFFDNDGMAKEKKWVSKLKRQWKISEVLPFGNISNECYGMALDNIDKIYQFLAGGSTLIRGMTEIYGDEKVKLAFKKALTWELSTFYYIDFYLHDEESRLNDNERILFIPHIYGEYLRMAKKSGAFFYDHPRIDVADNLNALGRVYGLFTKIRCWLLQFGTVTLYTFRLMMSGKRGSQIKKYKYAIPINNPDYQFKFKSRPVDFLLDGKDIRNDNTIFLLMNPTISKDNLEEMKSKKLNTIDCSNRFMPSWPILREALIYTVKYALPGLFEHHVLFQTMSILIYVFLKWSSILQDIKVEHLITFNDEGLDHIGRNILLNKTGARTWYYAHSASMSYISVPPDSDIRNYRHWLWSFLYYDYYVGWNDSMIEYYKLHPGAISNYVSVGCIWARSIVDILAGRGGSKQGKRIFANFDRNKYKTLSFFDSGYVPDSTSTLEDGVYFYQCILILLEEFPEILAVVKEKKSEETVLAFYQKLGGNSDIFYQHYRPALDKLRKHPRCHVTGYKGDPSETIAMSDLTVTYAFSSPSVESLCARKKALFFDTGNRWRDYYYDRIPNFVAHDYDELKRLIHYWLYEVTEKDFENFLNTYVKGEIDPYLDGQALTRLRKLLSE